jgi:PadR family transcriptional regulator PadR
LNKTQTNDLQSQDEILTLQVKKFRKELSSGTVAFVLLSIVAKADEPLYGYQIAKQFEYSGSEKQGSLYPVLRSLSSKGLLESYVMPSESGPPRKYFSISPLGQQVLTQWRQVWQETQNFVSQIIGQDSTAPQSTGDKDE